MGFPFEHYARASGRFDELTDEDGQLRPHWRYLTDALTSLGSVELSERQTEMRRLLFEHGISYNIYEDDKIRMRSWPMDLLPLVITSREWREIEVGIAQRAELLRFIMQDIYGEQTLIRHSLLPPQLVFGHRGFLAPCTSTALPLDSQLLLYGADLGRDPEGNIWVTGDRTQAPSGIGYALAARMVSSRVLPSVFRESNVHPVLPFLRDLRSCLIQLAEDELDQIALLTPGSANEAHAEHAYLARHLGLPLVEGSDLTITGGRCYLDDGEQRKPISVLLRRLDDDFCDPLELNRQSILGIPGGLQAVRNRTLQFANPLGSGVLENPALMAFLPAISHFFLGEDLKLPSQSTWWCGKPEHLDYVQGNWENMVIRSFQPNRKNPALAVCRLSQNARRGLMERVLAKPENYVAQTLNAHAMIPLLDDSGVVAHPAEMRTFAVSAKGGFRVMSGGLARVGRKPDSWRFSSQLGGMSKDIWVLASEPQRSAQTLPQFLSRLHSGALVLQPHQFEHLFWLGRYLARAEWLARLLSATYENLADCGSGQLQQQSCCLLQALTWQTTLYPGFVGPLGEAQLKDPVPELLRITYTEKAGGLFHDVAALLTTADSLRDQLGHQFFRHLGQLENSLQTSSDFFSARSAVDQAQVQLAALHGVLWRGLTEDRSRAIIELGLGIEQCLAMVRLVRSFTSDHATSLAASAELLFDLTHTPGSLRPELIETQAGKVLQNLLLSEHNAQSVRYQLMIIERLLRSLQASGQTDPLIADIDVRLTQLGTWSPEQRNDPQGEFLQERLKELDSWLRDLASTVEKRYQPRRPSRTSQLVEVA